MINIFIDQHYQEFLKSYLIINIYESSDIVTQEYQLKEISSKRAEKMLNEIDTYVIDKLQEMDRIEKKHKILKTPFYKQKINFILTCVKSYLGGLGVISNDTNDIIIGEGIYLYYNSRYRIWRDNKVKEIYRHDLNKVKLDGSIIYGSNIYYGLLNPDKMTSIRRSYYLECAYNKAKEIVKKYDSDFYRMVSELEDYERKNKIFKTKGYIYKQNLIVNGLAKYLSNIQIIKARKIKFKIGLSASLRVKYDQWRLNQLSLLMNKNFEPFIS